MVFFAAMLSSTFHAVQYHCQRLPHGFPPHSLPVSRKMVLPRQPVSPHAQPIQTVPTGNALAAPVGPATPVALTAMSACKSLCAPAAICLAQLSETACSSPMPSTPSTPCFTANA